MKLFELFDNVLKYDGPIVNGGTTMYTFMVEDLHYVAKFIDVKTDMIDYEFENVIDGAEELPDRVLEFSYGINLGYKIEMGMSNTGNSIQVFSTILDILKKHTSTVKPRYIVFSAKESSRQKLYDTLTKRITKTMSYDLADTFNDREGKNYILKRK